MAISKKRLKQLIEQKAVIYAMKDNKYIYTIGLNQELDVVNWFGTGEYKLCVVEENGAVVCDIANIEELFETKEEAEWQLEFGNITSVRTLSIPSYEKVKRMIEPSEEYSFWFETADGWKNELIVVWNEYTEKFEVCVVGNCGAYEFKEDFTKENYIKACEVVKERFLEGSGDIE